METGHVWSQVTHSVFKSIQILYLDGWIAWLFSCSRSKKGPQRRPFVFLGKPNRCPSVIWEKSFQFKASSPRITSLNFTKPWVKKSEVLPKLNWYPNIYRMHQASDYHRLRKPHIISHSTTAPGVFRPPIVDLGDLGWPSQIPRRRSKTWFHRNF